VRLIDTLVSHGAALDTKNLLGVTPLQYCLEHDIIDASPLLKTFASKFASQSFLEHLEQNQAEPSQCSCQQIKCKYCNIQLQTCLKQDHEIICEKNEYHSCPNTYYGCKEVMKSNRIAEHLIICSCSRIICSVCFTDVPRAEFSQHYKKAHIEPRNTYTNHTIEDFPIKCSSCHVKYLRSEFASHLCFRNDWSYFDYYLGPTDEFKI